MKLTHLILPAVAGLVYATLINGQQRTITILTEKTVLLSERLQQFSEESETRKKERFATAADKKSDLKNIAKSMKELENGEVVGNIRAMLRLQSQLMAMSVEELVAALEDADELGLSDDELKALRGKFIQMLASKDPGLALQKYGKELLEDGGWSVRSALTQFALKDPLGAMAWVDEQVAKGNLENKSLHENNSPRAQIEAALLQSLLGKQDGLISERLATLPEKERLAAMEKVYLEENDKPAQLAFGQLIRANVPEKKQADFLADKFYNIVDMDGKKAGELFETLKSSSSERAQVANKMLEKSANRSGMKTETLVKSYQWVKKLAPEESPATMGEALGMLATSGQEKAAMSQLLELRKSGENEKMVVSYLQFHGSQMNAENTQLLLNELSEGAEKEKMRKLLGAVLNSGKK